VNCEYYQELISARLDGELSREEEQALAEHLEGCESCREFSAALGGVKKAAAEDSMQAMPVELENEILRQTVNAEQKKGSILGFIKGYYRIPRGLAWATAALLLILAVNSFRGSIDGGPIAEPKVEIINQAFVIQRVTLSQDDVIMSKTVTADDARL